MTEMKDARIVNLKIPTIPSRSMVVSSALPVLLVDGYNIIGAWPALQKARDRLGLEASRQDLIQNLIDYSAFQGLSTQLIFDAQYRRGPGGCEVITQNLAVYYTEFGQTADTYIEKICALAQQEQAQRLIVATSDRAQKLTIMGYGAEWFSAQQLADQVKAVTTLVQQQQKRLKKAPGRLLAHSLDPAAKDHLEKLRRI